MFDFVSQIIGSLLVVGLFIGFWSNLGGKGKSFAPQLLTLVVGAIVLIAFFAPDSDLGLGIINTLSFIFKPLGLVMILLLIGIAGIKQNDKGVYTGAENEVVPSLVAAFLILLICCTPFIANWFAEQAEQEAIKAMETRPCCGGSASAIVLLGRGTTQYNTYPNIGQQLTDTGDRITYAAQLYQQKLAPYIIISAGPRLELEDKPSESQDIAKLLINNMGIPKSRIILDKKSVNLHNSAIAVKEILSDRNLDLEVILVTSALQIRRAHRVFAKEDITSHLAATDFYSFPPDGKLRRKVRGGDFFPNVESLLITTRIIDEYLISCYYFLRGWLAPV